MVKATVENRTQGCLPRGVQVHRLCLPATILFEITASRGDRIGSLSAIPSPIPFMMLETEGSVALY